MSAFGAPQCPSHFTASQRDTWKMDCILARLCRIPLVDLKKSPLRVALFQKGVCGFNDLVSMPDSFFKDMTVEDEHGNPLMIPPVQANLLRCAVSMYHHASRKGGTPVKIHIVPLAAFNDFRVHKYDPNKPIIPWHVKENNDPDVLNWNKMVKVSRNDYKPIKDEAR